MLLVFKPVFELLDNSAVEFKCFKLQCRHE
jgi:hypothetical protein